MIGEVFGRLRVIREGRKVPYGHQYVCLCECGNEKTIAGSRLRSGAIKSCGCLGGEEVKIGDKFGKLTVLREAERHANGRRQYLCSCECDNEKIATAKSLRNGDIKSCGCLRGKHLRHDLTGQIFGRLKVIDRAESYKFKNIMGNLEGGGSRYLCLCECGTEKIVNANNLVRGLTQSCGECRVPTGPDNVNWKGYGELGGRYFGAIKAGAKTRGFEFDITIEFVWNLFIQQGRRCALSNVELVLGTRDTEMTASLDRIDSSKGYFESNVQWVHKDLNRMKLDYPNDYFIDMCKKVADHAYSLREPILQNYKLAA